MFVHLSLKFFNQFLPNFCTKYRKGNLRHLSSHRRLISLIFHTSSMTLFSFFSCSDGISYNNSVESISRKHFTVEILNFLAKNSKVCLLSWKRWDKIERNEDLVSQREWQFTPITTSHSSVRLLLCYTVIKHKNSRFQSRMIIPRRYENGHVKALKQDVETGSWSDINVLDEIDDSTWAFETLGKLRWYPHCSRTKKKDQKCSEFST